MDKYWSKIKLVNDSMAKTQELKKVINISSLTNKLNNIIVSFQSPTNNRKQK